MASSSEFERGLAEVEDPIKRGGRRQQTEFLAALGEQTLDQHGVDAIRGEHRLRNALRRILIVVESRCSERKIEIGDDRRHFRNRRQAPRQIVGDGGRSNSTLGADDRDHAPKRLGAGHANSWDIAWMKSTTPNGATRYSLTPRAINCR